MENYHDQVARRLEKAADARKAIEQGRLMLEREGNDSPKMRDVVWRLLQDAAETLTRLPDPERRFFLQADKAAWPEVVRSAQEKFEAEVQRLYDLQLSKEETKPPRLNITDPSAINRMLVVLDWLQYVRARTRQRVKRDQTVVLAMANGSSMRHVRRLMQGDKSDGAAYMIKQKVVGQIATRLEKLLEKKSD